MPKVVVELSGVLYDKLARTQRPVYLKAQGNAITVEEPGVPPDPGGGGPVDPGWGVPEHPADPGYFPPRPAHPIYPGGPGAPGGKPPIDIGAHPEHPIVIPDPVPPDMQPPAVPPPGTATAVPGNWPVAPIVPAPYMVVNYPGVGPLVVTPPAQPAPS